MVDVTVICVGKLKEKFYQEAAAEYAKRLKGYCKLNIVELAEQKLPKNPSLGEIQWALEKEGDAIRAKIPPNSSVIALAVEGTLRSSEELAAMISTCRQAPGVRRRRILRAAPLRQGGGVGYAVHVAHDLSPPSGAGDAAGADLPGVQNPGGGRLP